MQNIIHFLKWKSLPEFIFGFEPLQPYLVTAETILYEDSALKNIQF